MFYQAHPICLSLDVMKSTYNLPHPSNVAAGINTVAVVMQGRNLANSHVPEVSTYNHPPKVPSHPRPITWVFSRLQEQTVSVGLCLGQLWLRKVPRKRSILELSGCIWKRSRLCFFKFVLSSSIPRPIKLVYYSSAAPKGERRSCGAAVRC